MHLQPLRLTLGLSLALSLAISSPTSVVSLLAPVSQHMEGKPLELAGEALRQRAPQLEQAQHSLEASTSQLTARSAVESKPAMGVGEARRRRAHRAREATLNSKGAELSTDEVYEASAEVDPEPEARGFHAYSGRGTYYKPNLGACGWHNHPGESVVALGVAQYDHGNHCGKNIRVCHGPKCISVTVVDKCMGCKFGSLDLSPTAFAHLAPKSEGVINVSWDFAS